MLVCTCVSPFSIFPRIFPCLGAAGDVFLRAISSWVTAHPSRRHIHSPSLYSIIDTIEKVKHWTTVAEVGAGFQAIAAFESQSWSFTDSVTVFKGIFGFCGQILQCDFLICRNIILFSIYASWVFFLTIFVVVILYICPHKLLGFLGKEATESTIDLNHHLSLFQTEFKKKKKRLKWVKHRLRIDLYILTSA